MALGSLLNADQARADRPLPFGGTGAGVVAAFGSAVFMMLLLDVWRKLKLLRDDPTEHLQRSLTIFWAKDLPEAMQGYPLAGLRFRRKKAPSWLSRMTLPPCVVWRWASYQSASFKKAKTDNTGNLGEGPVRFTCASYVYCFWGEQKQLDRFLQAYAVEKVRIEAVARGTRSPSSLWRTVPSSSAFKREANTMKCIEIIVSPTGETRLETKGFVGSECLQASQFLEVHWAPRQASN